MTALVVRDEGIGDAVAVRDVVARAFEQAEEALLVDRLRAAGKAIITMVAERDAQVVGSVLFSPVTLEGEPFGLGLAPLAVAPEVQKQGIGAALVQAGLARARATGHGSVVVLGSPAYYGRFGFAPAEGHRLRCEYDVPAGVFQVVELTLGALVGRSGLVRYASEFAAV